MVILIAESKTMQENEMPVSAREFSEHCPAGETAADEVMHRVSLMSSGQIADSIKISQAMAAKVSRMAYEFPNKSVGLRAIDAYTGVVFRAFGYSSLTPEDQALARRAIRIISSLYGWLRPDDFIKPYRFDFTTRLAPGDRSFSTWWRKDVTINLVRCLQESGENTILNLLPADAAACIDWKLVKRFSKVWKVDFKELKDGGDWRTPNAGKLKTMRGLLLREIITRRLFSPASLLTLETDSLMPLGTPDYPDRIAFCV
ncbi:MAG: YaaA family protein [Muribaculaceae bacterium]|nr:YaaA family protein [Muribaculaceae bacterium]